MTEKERITLKNGYYQNKSNVTSLHKVDGENVTIHSIISMDYPDMVNQGQYDTLKIITYSRVPNRRVGWNKSVGGAKQQNSTNVLDGINMLEEQNVKSSKDVGGANLLKRV